VQFYRVCVCVQVIREWEGYSGMMFMVRAFVTQISKMVGPEPKEELSHSNSTLIPTYVVSPGL